MRTIAFITIRGLAWAVCETREPKIDDETVHGFCDYDARRIVIDEELDGLLRARTIIHEICHAASGDISEDLVESLEEAIALGLTVIGYDLETPRSTDA